MAALIGIHIIFINVDTLLETNWAQCVTGEEGYLASMTRWIKVFWVMMLIFFTAIGARFANLIAAAWTAASEEYEATRTADDEIPQANDNDGF